MEPRPKQGSKREKITEWERRNGNLYPILWSHKKRKGIRTKTVVPKLAKRSVDKKLTQVKYSSKNSGYTVVVIRIVRQGKKMLVMSSKS